jgi:AhpD family alkylhydroperoxidase
VLLGAHGRHLTHRGDPPLLTNLNNGGERVLSAHQTRNELLEPARRLRGAIPDVIGAYAAMERAAMVDGALSIKVKELIALAIAATRECDGCVAAHARGAARAQATEAEVAEAMGVVVMMNGGPGTVWGTRAAAAHREFSAEETNAAWAARR